MGRRLPWAAVEPCWYGLQVSRAGAECRYNRVVNLELYKQAMWVFPRRAVVVLGVLMPESGRVVLEYTNPHCIEWLVTILNR